MCLGGGGGRGEGGRGEQGRGGSREESYLGITSCQKVFRRHIYIYLCPHPILCTGVQSVDAVAKVGNLEQRASATLPVRHQTSSFRSGLATPWNKVPCDNSENTRRKYPQKH